MRGIVHVRARTFDGTEVFVNGFFEGPSTAAPDHFRRLCETGWSDWRTSAHHPVGARDVNPETITISEAPTTP